MGRRRPPGRTKSDQRYLTSERENVWGPVVERRDAEIQRKLSLVLEQPTSAEALDAGRRVSGSRRKRKPVATRTAASFESAGSNGRLDNPATSVPGSNFAGAALKEKSPARQVPKETWYPEEGARPGAESTGAGPNADDAAFAEPFGCCNHPANDEGRTRSRCRTSNGVDCKAEREYFALKCSRKYCSNNASFGRRGGRCGAERESFCQQHAWSIYDPSEGQEDEDGQPERFVSGVEKGTYRLDTHFLEYVKEQRYQRHLAEVRNLLPEKDLSEFNDTFHFKASQSDFFDVHSGTEATSGNSVTTPCGAIGRDASGCAPFRVENVGNSGYIKADELSREKAPGPPGPSFNATMSAADQRLASSVVPAQTTSSPPNAAIEKTHAPADIGATADITSAPAPVSAQGPSETTSWRPEADPASGKGTRGATFLPWLQASVSGFRRGWLNRAASAPVSKSTPASASTPPPAEPPATPVVSWLSPTCATDLESGRLQPFVKSFCPVPVIEPISAGGLHDPAEARAQIFVEVQGVTSAVDVSLGSTVGELQGIIARRHGHAHWPVSLYLASEGRVLVKESSTLETLGVKKGDTVHVHVRARGGSPGSNRIEAAPDQEMATSRTDETGGVAHGSQDSEGSYLRIQSPPTYTSHRGQQAVGYAARWLIKALLDIARRTLPGDTRGGGSTPAWATFLRGLEERFQDLCQLFMLIAIYGVNQAGKSTLFNCLAGFGGVQPLPAARSQPPRLQLEPAEVEAGAFRARHAEPEASRFCVGDRFEAWFDADGADGWVPGVISKALGRKNEFEVKWKDKESGVTLQETEVVCLYLNKDDIPEERGTHPQYYARLGLAVSSKEELTSTEGEYGVHFHPSGNTGHTTKVPLLSTLGPPNKYVASFQTMSRARAAHLQHVLRLNMVAGVQDDEDEDPGLAPNIRNASDELDWALQTCMLPPGKCMSEMVNEDVSLPERLSPLLGKTFQMECEVDAGMSSEARCESVTKLVAALKKHTVGGIDPVGDLTNDLTCTIATYSVLERPGVDLEGIDMCDNPGFGLHEGLTQQRDLRREDKIVLVIDSKSPVGGQEDAIEKLVETILQDKPVPVLVTLPGDKAFDDNRTKKRCAEGHAGVLVEKFSQKKSGKPFDPKLEESLRVKEKGVHDSIKREVIRRCASRLTKRQSLDRKRAESLARAHYEQYVSHHTTYATMLDIGHPIFMEGVEVNQEIDEEDSGVPAFVAELRKPSGARFEGKQFADVVIEKAINDIISLLGELVYQFNLSKSLRGQQPNLEMARLLKGARDKGMERFKNGTRSLPNLADTASPEFDEILQALVDKCTPVEFARRFALVAFSPEMRRETAIKSTISDLPISQWPPRVYSLIKEPLRQLLCTFGFGEHDIHKLVAGPLYEGNIAIPPSLVSTSLIKPLEGLEELSYHGPLQAKVALGQESMEAASHFVETTTGFTSQTTREGLQIAEALRCEAQSSIPAAVRKALRGVDGPDDLCLWDGLFGCHSKSVKKLHSDVTELLDGRVIDTSFKSLKAAVLILESNLPVIREHVRQTLKTSFESKVRNLDKACNKALDAEVRSKLDKLRNFGTGARGTSRESELETVSLSTAQLISKMETYCHLEEVKRGLELLLREPANAPGIDFRGTGAPQRKVWTAKDYSTLLWAVAPEDPAAAEGVCRFSALRNSPDLLATLSEAHLVRSDESSLSDHQTRLDALSMAYGDSGVGLALKELTKAAEKESTEAANPEVGVGPIDAATVRNLVRFLDRAAVALWAWRTYGSSSTFSEKTSREAMLGPFAEQMGRLVASLEPGAKAAPEVSASAWSEDHLVWLLDQVLYVHESLEDAWNAYRNCVPSQLGLETDEQELETGVEKSTPRGGRMLAGKYAIDTGVQGGRNWRKKDKEECHALLKEKYEIDRDCKESTGGKKEYYFVLPNGTRIRTLGQVLELAYQLQEQNSPKQTTRSTRARKRPRHIACTKCGETHRRGELVKHPFLGVAMCKPCDEAFWNSDGRDRWHKDADGFEDYCCWCGDGSDRLKICDAPAAECGRVFCTECLERHFDAGIVGRIDAADGSWRCPKCDPKTGLTPISALQHDAMELDVSCQSRAVPG